MKTGGGLRWATTTKTGPNDARHVIWALVGMFFRIFYILTITNRFYLRYEDRRGRRQPKQAQTTQDMSFGPSTRYVLFLFHCVFSYTNKHLLLYLASTYAMEVPGALWWAVMSKTGPNDARHVVWAYI
jgi:hypothetical protein